MDDSVKATYVSVIKVNGRPILPPIITPKLRKELSKYKQQAIKLERRLEKCRELKRNLDDLLEAQHNQTRPLSELTFGDNSHIDALNINDKPKSPRKLKNVHLSRDLIEVTQYDDSGLRTICPNTISDDKLDSFSSSSCDNKQSISNSKSTPNVDPCRGSSDSRKLMNEFGTTSKPRLIRSNSYTLESPSPILLQHLKRTSQNNATLDHTNNQPSVDSLDNNSSDFNSLNTVFHKEMNDSPDKSASTTDEVKSPTIEVYQTDISVQQITVNTNGGGGNEAKKECFFSSHPFEVLEPDSELINVLKDIPDTYANQIIDMLKKQRLEQKERLERYDKSGEMGEKSSLKLDDLGGQSDQVRGQQYEEKSMFFTPSETFPTPQLISPTKQSLNSDNLIDFTSLTELDLSTPLQSNSNSRPNTGESRGSTNRPHSGKLKRSSTFSMSPSQSLYYSVTSDSDTISAPITPSVNLAAFGEKSGDLEVGVLQEKNGYWEGILKHESREKNLSCSRELFPEIDPVTMKALKQEWAASVIGAHVRGYLTRRLINTEKVQGLIATVKDVLLCALELHHSDNIDEKDVELHRRLINQLSAALYSFHDIFFELSTAEKMALIAADRQRKLEKLLRPQSANRRSVRGARSATSNNSDRSLTSSRSSSKHKLISESPSLTKV